MSHPVVRLVIVCITTLITVQIVTSALESSGAGTWAYVSLFTMTAVASATGFWCWYLVSTRKSRAETANSERNRQLVDEYRRLADLAITAQEHTDLKLGDVSVRIDYLRDQLDGLQKSSKTSNNPSRCGSASATTPTSVVRPG